MRDANGDIVDVREVHDDEMPALAGAANLPPAMGPRPALPQMPPVGGMPGV